MILNIYPGEEMTASIVKIPKQDSMVGIIDLSVTQLEVFNHRFHFMSEVLTGPTFDEVTVFDIDTADVVTLRFHKAMC